MFFQNFCDVPDGNRLVVIVFRGGFFDGLLFYHGIDGCGDLADLVFIPFAVPAPFAADPPFFQLNRGIVEHAETLRHFGADKTGKQFCISAAAAPIVERKDGDFRLLLRKDVLSVQGADDDGCRAQLGKLGQKERRDDGRRRDLHGTFKGNLVEVFGKRKQKAVPVFNDDVDVLESTIRISIKLQCDEQRDAVEIVRIAVKLLCADGQRGVFLNLCL